MTYLRWFCLVLLLLLLIGVLSSEQFAYSQDAETFIKMAIFISPKTTLRKRKNPINRLFKSNLIIGMLVTGWEKPMR